MDQRRLINKMQWHPLSTCLQNPYHSWRVAGQKDFFADKIKKDATKECFVYTPRTPFNNSSSLGNTSSASVMVECEGWSSNAAFPDGQNKTLQDVVTRLHVAVDESTGSIFTSSTYDDFVLFMKADYWGISLLDRTLFTVLRFKGLLDPNRGMYFIGNNDNL